MGLRLRVAIIHYWLVGMRGGEKVLEALCNMYPSADIYTHVYDPAVISEVIKKHKIFTTFINRLPYSPKLYKKYLPLMPMALEQLDLSDYDLVISSESGPAKGVLPMPGAVHVCYCHSPMRYIWNMYNKYYDSSGLITRMVMPPLAHYLRNWDVATSNRVDRFSANSATVAQRIKTYYRRDAQVIHPPVDTNAFQAVAMHEVGDHYLMVGELVSYKRPDLAVIACNLLKAKLVVIGGGEMLERIRKLAGPTVTILGPQPFDVLRLPLRSLPRAHLSGGGGFRDRSCGGYGQRSSCDCLREGRSDRNGRRGRKWGLLRCANHGGADRRHREARKDQFQSRGCCQACRRLHDRCLCAEVWRICRRDDQ